LNHPPLLCFKTFFCPSFVPVVPIGRLFCQETCHPLPAISLGSFPQCIAPLLSSAPLSSPDVAFYVLSPTTQNHFMAYCAYSPLKRRVGAPFPPPTLRLSLFLSICLVARLGFRFRPRPDLKIFFLTMFLHAFFRSAACPFCFLTVINPSQDSELVGFLTSS